MNKLILLTAALLLTMLCLSKASADTCTVNATGVAFGSVSPLTDQTVDATGTITVTCDFGTLYTIKLSWGHSGTYFPRKMASGVNEMEYNLYQDASHFVVWGDDTGGSLVVPGSTLVNLSNDHIVYGRIPVSPTTHVGNYSDSITVTVTY